VNRSKITAKETFNEQQQKTKPYNLGLQVSSGMDSKISKKSNKGKSAIHIARTYAGKRRNFTGQSFWARGYFVSTVGRDEETVKKYIQKQETFDKRLDQLELF
jgi:hypothetical protein